MIAPRIQEKKIPGNGRQERTTRSSKEMKYQWTDYPIKGGHNSVIPSL